MTARPQLTLDHAHASAVARELCVHATSVSMPFFRELDLVSRYVSMLPFFSASDGGTEHLLHEVGHAIALGVGIQKWFSSETEYRLDRVEPLRTDHRNEACVLAAEWIFYGYTSTPIRLGLLRKEAHDQVVPRRWLDRACTTKRAFVLADSLARWALEQGVLVKTGMPTDLAFADLRRRIREAPQRPGSSVVERRLEKSRVAGSTPAWGTKERR